MINILVVERRQRISEIIRQSFKRKAKIHTVHNIECVLEMFSQTLFDVLVWHSELSDTTNNSYGLELLEVLSMDSPKTQIIIISNPDDTLLAIRGIEAGAFQFIQEPVKTQDLLALVDVAIQKQPAAVESKLLHQSKRGSFEFEGIYGVSRPIIFVIQQIREAALSDTTILITGETGTGKDLVASAIHKNSKRRSEPFIVVNTGAIAAELISSELFGHEKGAFTGAIEKRHGFFEQADKGTLFLDEIGTMDHKTQVSLLRLIETKSFVRVGGKKKMEVDVRVIAATNEDLAEAVKRKKFREDLYYRFDVFQINIPPLRERPGDIPFLANLFISQFNNKYNKQMKELQAETIHYLERYPWPGNVRELKNVMQRCVLISRSDIVKPENLPQRIRENTEDKPSATHPFCIGMTLADMEKEFIALTLASTKGNKQKAAKILGISRKAFYDKLKRHGLFRG